MKKGEEDLTTNVTVSIIFYYTQNFDEITPDIKGHVEHLISNTNIVFMKSGIPLRLAIHCMLQSKLREAPDSGDRIREFKESQGEQNKNFKNFPSILLHDEYSNIYIMLLQAVKRNFCNQQTWQCFLQIPRPMVV